MSEGEQTTAGLTVPNPNSTRPTTGTSEAASRAETLTNQHPTEKPEHILAGENGGDHVSAPSSVKDIANNEKNEERDAIAVTPAGDANTVATGAGQGAGANRADDDDRYITGFRLFLVFVYVTLLIFFGLPPHLETRVADYCCPFSLVSSAVQARITF
jgi:hypothetical protein